MVLINAVNQYMPRTLLLRFHQTLSNFAYLCETSFLNDLMAAIFSALIFCTQSLFLTFLMYFDISNDAFCIKEDNKSGFFSVTPQRYSVSRVYCHVSIVNASSIFSKYIFRLHLLLALEI